MGVIPTFSLFVKNSYKIPPSYSNFLQMWALPFFPPAADIRKVAFFPGANFSLSWFLYFQKNVCSLISSIHSVLFSPFLSWLTALPALCKKCYTLFNVKLTVLLCLRSCYTIISEIFLPCHSLGNVFALAVILPVRRKFNFYTVCNLWYHDEYKELFVLLYLYLKTYCGNTTCIFVKNRNTTCIDQLIVVKLRGPIHQYEILIR